MKAVILAGGLGSRLRPFTQIIPKPLLPIGEKAVLEIQIERLRRSGVEDVYLATNYRSDYIASFIGDGSSFGLRIHFSKEEEPLGTCGPLRLIRDQLDEPFVVMNGDILTTLDFAKLFRFAGETPSDLVVVSKKFTTPFRFGNLETSDGYITCVNEKPDLVFEILAGIYLMKPPIFDHIPAGTYFGMDHLIKKLLDEKVPVARYLLEDYWLDIGSMDDFSTAQDIYDEHFNDGPSTQP